MNGLTPEWALDAYDRIKTAERDISQAEREEMKAETERMSRRARLNRGYERVA